MTDTNAEMEDAHTIKMSMEKHPQKAFFGVYDGHNGDVCAHWSAENLWKYVDNLDDHTDQSVVSACLAADKEFLTTDPETYVVIV